MATLLRQTGIKTPFLLELVSTHVVHTVIVHNTALMELCIVAVLLEQHLLVVLFVTAMLMLDHIVVGQTRLSVFQEVTVTVKTLVILIKKEAKHVI